MTRVRTKTRRLWLKVFYDVPKDIPRREILNTLLRGIRDRTYSYPRSWRVALQWKNKQMASMRTGEWTNEMQNSAESSSGFDAAVASYLENQL
jgi:hypothetical protein